MNWYFLFFFISGFCSILYEIVWLRLAMAQFGVTTALVSIVLSMFMAGLGLGSWASAWLLRLYAADPDAPLWQQISAGRSGGLVPAYQTYLIFPVTPF